MNNKNIVARFLLVSGAFFAAPLSVAGQLPADARPLTEIVATLEHQGYGPIVDVDFGDGRWEVEAYREGRRYALQVDPRSAAVLAVRADV